MNRFIEYFGRFSQTDRVEVEDGCFELRSMPYKDLDTYGIRIESEESFSCKRLYFTESASAKETVVCDFVRSIRPFGENGVACSMRFPLGDRHLNLFFRTAEGIRNEDGYIADSKHLYHTCFGELRCCYERCYDHMIVSKESLENYGFCEEIHFRDDFFWIPSRNNELVPKIFLSYTGMPDEVQKQHAVAEKIMQQLALYISKNLNCTVPDNTHSRILRGLIWDATSATIQDAVALLEAESAINNLDAHNGQELSRVIDLFKAGGNEALFTRYFEFFFTFTQSLKKHVSDLARVSCQPSAAHRAKLYEAVDYICFNHMSAITAELLARKDLHCLLEDFSQFRTAINKVVRETYNIG